MSRGIGCLLLLLSCLCSSNVSAESIRDCASCPEMVVVPSGSFAMGSPFKGEGPIRTVQLTSFAIGRFEVTQAEWRALMGAHPLRFPDCGDRCPVENVSWHDALAFVQRLSARSGQRYRLPSEAEWEYACRAGGQHDLCGGNEAELLAWSGDEYGETHPVGHKKPNAWGLYDMSGNVWEWTQDCTTPDYLGAPLDASPREHPACSSRILRGGSWLDGPTYARASLRFGFKPDFRAGDIGFRVVREMR